MTSHDTALHTKPLSGLAGLVDTISYEIVDISGFFDLIEGKSKDQTSALTTLKSSAATVTGATKTVRDVAVVSCESAAKSREIVEETVTRVRESGASANTLATWVSELSQRSVQVSDTLKIAKSNNQQIASIARQVNTLAINAKIEAARAGEAGLGFAVVAEAINELSRKTGGAAAGISENIETLSDWIVTLGTEAKEIAEKASTLLENATFTDDSLTKMETAIQENHAYSERIEKEARTMRGAMNTFSSNLTGIETAVNDTSKGISQAHLRIETLVDTSEAIVQGISASGGSSTDARFYDHVQSVAQEMSAAFEAALDSGRVSMDDLFDEAYQPIPGSDPVQVMTRFTSLTDDIALALQEAALDLDPRVVFCAAVDRNGYLPTHNLKFSRPQSDDPVWNTANCRNRRVFSDRVGLKAGKNTAPFLCQVYRRDMGGGEFTMMKDISAPIQVKGRHWGGMRLAIRF